MTDVRLEEAPWLGALERVADDFAVRALASAASRDRARPGTGAQHLHAHSATLWRQAEQHLRALLRDLSSAGDP